MVPLCLDQQIGLLPWSPLARGVLARPLQADTTRAKTDTYAKNLYGAELPPSDAAVHAALWKVAAARGVPAAQVALAWLMGKPGVVAPIIGASKPQHIDDAVAALGIKLAAEEVAALEAAYAPHAVAGHQ